MSYRKLFLFLLLFSFFALDFDYQADQLDSHKWSPISVSWPLALADSSISCTKKDSNWDCTGIASVCANLNLSKLETKIGDFTAERDKDSTSSERVEELSKALDACRKVRNFYEDEKKQQEEREKEKKEKKAQCQEEQKEMTETAGDFGKACAGFARGMGCEEAVTACAMCPAPGESAELNSYNCVAVHKKTKCPLLAGEELKLAKEKRDKVQESVEELEEEVSELEKDIVEKQNELNKSLAELEENFNEVVSELERETENAKEDLEASLNENKATIKNEVSKQIAQVQEVVDKSLEIAHSFENAITTANMNYRAEVKKVYAECRLQAQTQLAKYRSKRKQAVESGAYKVSLSSLTSKNRISFAKKDMIRLQQYYRECLVLRKSDLKDLKLAHQQKMRVIAQQREQYQKKMESLKQKVLALNKMAYEQQNTLVQDYAKRMDKVISQHAKQYGLALKNYEKNKRTLLSETSKINVLQKHLTEKKQILSQKKRELVAEQQVIAYLKSKAVSEEDEGSHTAYSETAGALVDYESAVYTAYTTCGCENFKSNSRKKKDKEDETASKEWSSKKYCPGIKRKKDNLEESGLETVIQKMKGGFGNR